MIQRQREYDSDLRHLADMRAFVRAAWLAGLSPEHADDKSLIRLELALTEAVSNIILHGYDGQPERPITVRVDADDDQVRVTLLHQGATFDPQATPPPTFDGSREGGFGVYLIRACVDEVQYDQDEQGRQMVRLTQNRKSLDNGEDHGADD
jgi:anti-sigma regulatory factor (Ser/Thr protein kinase)